jgi:hypothetical protein
MYCLKPRFDFSTRDVRRPLVDELIHEIGAQPLTRSPQNHSQAVLNLS